MKQIDENITIEELTETYPKTVQYLSKHHIRCIICGEPIWGTLKEACEEKKKSEEEIKQIVQDINELINK